MAPRLLAIESATDWLSVALLEGEGLIEIRHAEGASGPSPPTVRKSADGEVGGVDAASDVGDIALHVPPPPPPPAKML